MKLYSIRANASNWHSGTSFFHTVMFHGEAVLPQGRYGSASHEIGERDMVPMRIIANGFHYCDVFVPERSCNLVVSERVMKKLEPIRANFQFLPVVFEKVYILPWSLDGRHELELPPFVDKYRRLGRERTILEKSPHDPKAAAALPPYYEVVAYNHYDLLKRFPPTHQFFTMWYEGEPLEHDLLPVSKAMFEVFPISDPGYTVVRDDIFGILSPFLDLPFFGIKEFSFES